MTLGLFDAREFETRFQPPRELDDYAFLYTATATGKSGGVRFALTVEEAVIWCSSDLSRGTLYGTEWAYFWTRVSAFVIAFGDEIVPDRAFDNGEWDDRIASLGLQKISLSEFPEVFGPFGLTFPDLEPTKVSPVRAENRGDAGEQFGLEIAA